MTSRRVIARWWRSVKHEHAYSGVRIWVDAWRDWKAANLREVRRVRDKQTAARKALFATYPPMPSLGQFASNPYANAYMQQAPAAQIAALQQANLYGLQSLSKQPNRGVFDNLLGLRIGY